MEITETELRKEMLEVMKYHLGMMKMFKKTHGVKCFGYRGHNRGLERAKSVYNDLLWGHGVSARTVAAYKGKGWRLVKDEEGKV
ncbi:MAG TPA: hypothetical protein VN278_06065 [Methanosarcina sp.]|nr:hypothetical protein [Methanosarcina sp.]